MKEQKTGLKRLNLIELILLFGVFFLPGYLSQTSVPDTSLFNSVQFNLFYILSSLPQILLLFYIMLNRGRVRTVFPYLSRFGIRPFKAIDLGRSLLVYAGIFGVLGIVVLVSIAFFQGNAAFWTNRVDWRLDSPALLPLAVLSLLVTGYREELFFRSYLITRLEELGIPGWASALIGSVLFALGHIYQGPTAFIGTFLIGLFLSFVFLRGRNFHPLAIAHGLYNITAILLVSLFPQAAGTG